ncbi:AAA domain-containing protein [Thermoanaerobacter thermohydrosulfuricus]|uniref:AAA domain-containing protein n=1 Tax=Thermoanaerobacter thermohydrosulfuricus TaxID=1516 RepID=A0A1G7HNG5_THETY|nr:AAA family ATPase [Thermoanaerobacter thermohydrosulfuricus]SDF02002.1 AAA domain-containing protein [Thermoanaerobacter thermohydrosulfuricus]
MNLLISNNPKIIEAVKNRGPCDIALSLESALIRAKYKKYDLIINDGFNASGFFDSTINVRDYLKNATDNQKVKVIKQEIISVWSVKGGAGKTTVVRKLAEMFDKNIKILVIDLNFQDGGSDLSFLLDLPVIPHIGIYLKEKTKENFFKNLIEYSSNISILQAPPKLNFVKDMKAEDVENIIKFAKAAFDVIIFDLPNKTDEIVNTVLENSTRKIIVSSGLVSEARRIKELVGDFIVVINSPNRQWKLYYKDFNCITIKELEKILER